MPTQITAFLTRLQEFMAWVDQYLEANPTANMGASMTMCAVLAYFLGLYFRAYGRTFSNRDNLSRDLMLIALTTGLIIRIVHSDISLSLGLVGALSIVRFRASIKEPEELAFLFLAIAIGLGAGAGQIKLTILGFFAILFFYHLRNRSKTTLVKDLTRQLHVELPDSGSDTNLKEIVSLVEQNAMSVAVTRFDCSGGSLNLSIGMKVDDIFAVDLIRGNLMKKYPNARINYVEVSPEYEI